MFLSRTGQDPDRQTAASRPQTAGPGHHPSQDQAAQTARNPQGATQTNSAVFWILIKNYCELRSDISVYQCSVDILRSAQKSSQQLKHIFPILLMYDVSKTVIFFAENL